MRRHCDRCGSKDLKPTMNVWEPQDMTLTQVPEYTCLCCETEHIYSPMVKVMNHYGIVNQVHYQFIRARNIKTEVTLDRAIKIAIGVDREFKYYET